MHAAGDALRPLARELRTALYGFSRTIEKEEIRQPPAIRRKDQQAKSGSSETTAASPARRRSCSA